MKFKVLAGVAIALIIAYVGAKVYAGRVAERKVKEAITNVSPFVAVGYKKVGVDFLPPRVRVSGVTLTSRKTGKTLNVEEVTLRDGDTKSKLPTYLNLSCTGIELNPDDFPANKAELRELGYDKSLLMALEIDYAYNKEAKELRVKTLSMSVEKAGSVELGINIGALNLEPAALVLLAFSYPQILIQEAKLTYRDDSLFERLVKLEAKKAKLTPEALKQEWAQAITRDMDKDKDEFKRTALGEIKKFVERPRRISMAIAPAKPLTLGAILRLRDHKEAIEAVQVRIKAD